MGAGPPVRRAKQLKCEKPMISAVNGYAMGLGAIQVIAASKMAVNAYLRSVSSFVMPISLKYEELTMKSADHREAVKAFQEKRAPNFTGK